MGARNHISRGGCMQDNSALDRAMAMVRDLRARCPWDRAQTRETLRPYLAEERGDFSADQVAAVLEAKMRRRHPHLFELGEAEPWERIKRRERGGRTLDGITATLPP